MDPITTQCEKCEGTCFRPEVLGYRFQGRSVLDVFALTVDEAVDVFPEPKIRAQLVALMDVGLGYVTLGQSANTLSGRRVPAHEAGGKHSDTVVFEGPPGELLRCERSITAAYVRRDEEGSVSA